MHKKVGLMMAFVLAVQAYTQAEVYTGEVLPTPRQVLTKMEFLPLEAKAFGVVVEDPRNKTLMKAKELLEKRLTDAEAIATSKQGQKVTVRLGFMDSPFIKTLDQKYRLGLHDVILPPEGYVIRIVREAGGIQVIAAGVERRGAFYAAMTILQQIGVEKGQLGLKLGDINDWPVWQTRFLSDYDPFGPDHYLHLAKYKINGYGWQFRTDWWEFKPEYTFRNNAQGTVGNALKTIKKFRDEYGLMDFILALHLYADAGKNHPILDITNEQHIQEVLKRCRLAADHGINHIIFGTDDYNPTEKINGRTRFVCPNASERKQFGDSVGRAHGYLMKRLNDDLKRQYPEIQLYFIPAAYSLVDHNAYAPENLRYLRDLSAEMPKEVRIIWTGPRVVSRKIEQDDYLKYSRAVNGLTLTLWDNSECFDLPFTIWKTEFYPKFVTDARGTIFINCHSFCWPWVVPFSLNINDYLWNPEAFQSDRSYRNAVSKLFRPEAVDLVRTFREKFPLLKEGKDTARRKALLAELDGVVATLENLKLEAGWAKGPLETIRAELNFTPPLLAVPYLETPPAMDGDPGDESWSKAGRFEYRGGEGQKGPIHPVQGRIAYDKNHLYLGFIVSYAGTLPPQPFFKAYDDHIYSSLDAIELFLQPTRNGPYGHFVFNYEGKRFDANSGGSPGDWNVPWTVRVKMGEGRWTATVAIPWTSFKGLGGERPAKGTVWHGDFAREFNLKQEYTMWSPTYDTFHNSKFWGVLKFE